MASTDESLTKVFDEDYEDTDDWFQYQSRHSSLSRLSVCTSSLHDDEDAANNPSEVGVYMSGLSLESFDGDEADVEVSDVDKGGGKEQGEWSDSDKEHGFYSLPATPSRRRRKSAAAEIIEKERKKKEGTKCGIERQRREKRASWMVKGRGNQRNSNSDGGVRELELGPNPFGRGNVGLTVITRARGGKRSMRMGLEEVKACRDLGFDLVHERLSVEVVPGWVSLSGGSTLEGQTTSTSSGGNSPIAIGGDQREVKARLKVWAQAVALASSASRHGHAF